MTESAVLRDIRLAVGQLADVRLFRNSGGVATDPRTGAVVRFGLVVGASDLIGLVAPRGRFLALEVKAGKGRLTEEQAAFLVMVNSLGGVGREVRSVADALAAVTEARR